MAASVRSTPRATVDPIHSRNMRRDDPVPTEDGAEPGNASIGIGTEIGAGDQRVDVRGGSAGDFIEQIVGARDGGDLSAVEARRARRVSR